MNGPALLALQLIDSELDQIEQRRKRLPERTVLADATGAHARWRAERDRMQTLIADAVRVIEDAEASGKDLDVKQRRLEAQLKTVIAPREAEALMHEIDTLKARHGALDDVELTAMEQQAEADTAIEALDDIEPPLVAAVDQAKAALDEALGGLAAQVESAQTRRIDAVAALADGERSTYDTMKARHGGVGFAGLERHTCTACHVDLSQVEFERVVASTGDDLP
ncbi:MAG: hypothetical protein WEB78_07530, partial [Ilumatobacteraceae bacterium]